MPKWRGWSLKRKLEEENEEERRTKEEESPSEGVTIVVAWLLKAGRGHSLGEMRPVPSDTSTAKDLQDEIW